MQVQFLTILPAVVLGILSKSIGPRTFRHFALFAHILQDLANQLFKSCGLTPSNGYNR